MPEPSFLGDGVTPVRTDTRWTHWVKMLGDYQNRSGSLPANNPARSDGLRVIKQKLLCAIAGTSYTG
jgi:hypothetical protein